MSTQSTGWSRIDPRALPLGVKITIGVIVGLAASAVVIDAIVSRVVVDAQSDVALNDLQDFSRTQALRVVDVLGQEVVALSRLGSATIIQGGLVDHLAADVEERRPDFLDLFDPDAELTRQAVTFHQTHPEFDTVIVLDRNGHILAADPAPADLNRVSQPIWVWFTGALANGSGMTYLSSPQDDQLTGMTGVHIAVPVYSQEDPSTVIGVVYGIWNMSNVAELIQTGGGRQGVILEPDGTVLISATEEQGQAFPSGLTSIMQRSPSGSFIYTRASGERLLYSFVHLSDLSLSDAATTGLGWIVVTRQPVSSLESSIALVLTRVRLGLLLGGALVTLVVLALTRLLFHPLIRLTHAAREIGTGRLEIAIPQFPLDEIGRLASTLKQVVTQLLSRVQQLRAAVQVSRAVALTLDADQMVADVARVLGAQFDYPDVRIYLMDATGRRIRLHAGSGEESERLLRIGHRLPLDESNLVGRAMLLGESQLGGGKQALREAGLITENSELAVPLRAGGETLGGIHVIAGRLREINPDDIDLLRLIADQLSASIQNARLFEQSRSQVAEIEALNRRLTHGAWEEYMGEGGAIRHTLDPDNRWPERRLAVSAAQIKAEISEDNGRSVLSAPLILRGEVVGSLAVTRPGGERWTQDEILLMESIASRMAMIAEGIRLVDESTLRAEREHRVNEISANLLQQATSVESVLRSALNELGGALGSDRVALRIGSAPVRDAGHQIAAGAGEPEGQGGNGAEVEAGKTGTAGGPQNTDGGNEPGGVSDGG